jgi:hypothetical protein
MKMTKVFENTGLRVVFKWLVANCWRRPEHWINAEFVVVSLSSVRADAGLLGHGNRGQDFFHINLSRVISRVAGGAVGGFFSVGAGFLQAFDGEIG